MRPRLDSSRGGPWLAALTALIGGCLGEATPGTRTPRRQEPVIEGPAPADAGPPMAATSVIDAGARVPDAGAHTWRNAASCAALQRSKALGCCNPSPELLLCIVYNGANRVMGAYPARVLLATATDTQRVVANIPIEVRDHTSANAVDTTVGVVGLSVQPWGFELSAQQGCDGGESGTTKRMCANVGKHTWDGNKLVHEAK